jgi:hypothetical protein
MQLSCQHGKVKIAVNNGELLRQHHIDPFSSLPQDVLGQIEPHPKQQGEFILRNKSQQSWTYEYNGQSHRIDPTQARALGLGGKIKIGTAEIDIVAV